MKKICIIISAMLLLTCVLLTPTFASEYDNAAQELKTLGLFQGTTAGFDLDREPTRTEAGVMLVRLLGAENEAKTQYTEGKISHPFTDVADWADPYVAWLYQNKLANGVSDTLFGATNQCNAQMYCTFVLRALGYSDASGGDFTFATATTFAEKVGIYSSDLVADTFLRDHAAAISYQALATDLKGTSTTLLSDLVADGAISQTSAKATLDKITAYRAYAKVQTANSAITHMDMSLVGTMALESAQVAELNTNMDLTSSTKVILSDTDIQMESVSAVTTKGTTTNISMWIKDGYLYTNDGTNKTKAAIDDNMRSALVAQQTSSAEAPAFPIYMLDSISSAKTTAGTMYTIGLSDNFKAFDLSKMGVDTSSLTKFSIDSCNMQILVANDGTLTSMKMAFVFDMTVLDGSTPIDLTCNYDVTAKINATGSSVAIKFPDFSGYTEATTAKA